MEREHDERAWLAWHIAGLGRVKRMPKLQTMLSQKTARGPQPWQQQLAVMDMWVAVTRRRAQLQANK